MNRRLKLLLTGCGDIAVRLARQLPSDLYDVTGLRRSPEPLDGVTVLKGDACDSHTMSGLMLLGFDAIVMTLTPDERTVKGYRNSYYRAMEVLLDALATVEDPPMIFFVSSTSVYGQNQGEWVDEMSPTAPAGFTGQILLKTEQLLQGSGVPNCVVRFSGIYGPGRTRLLEPARTGAPLTRPFGWTNRIHSEDCAGVLAHLLARYRRSESLAPVYIGTDNAPVMQWQLRAGLSEMLGVEVAQVERDDAQESGKRCSNKRLSESGYQWRFSDYRSGYTALINNSKTSQER